MRFCSRLLVVLTAFVIASAGIGAKATGEWQLVFVKGLFGQEGRVVGTDGRYKIVEFRNLDGTKPKTMRMLKVDCYKEVFWDLDFPRYTEPTDISWFHTSLWACRDEDDKKPRFY